MLSRNARLALFAVLAMAVAAVGYLIYDQFVADVLPDAVALERTLAGMVADSETVARATRMLTRDGFECGLVAGQTTGTWHCDLAERIPTSELDCPRRISVLLVPDVEKKLTTFSVTDGEMCM